MNFSNRSNKFNQPFIDLIDDMLTDSTSNGEVDLIDDLLDLISERLVSLHDYYEDNLNSVRYYQRQIMERKVKSSVQQGDYTEVAKFLTNDDVCTADNC
jgi:hypothetical protein